MLLIIRNLNIIGVLSSNDLPCPETVAHGSISCRFAASRLRVATRWQLSTLLVFWPIRPPDEFELFWNWLGKNECPGALSP